MRALTLAFALALFSGCGDPGGQADNPYGNPPSTSDYDAGGYDPGGYGDGGTKPTEDTGPVKPMCEDALKRCAVDFTYPAGAESSVEVRGDYRDDGWTKGDPMTKSGSTWKVSIPLPYGKDVQYKLVIDGTTWILDPGNPATVKDASGNENSLKKATTCTDFTCAEPDVPPPGVFDWRDSVIYFAFVDRFLDGDSSNNGSLVSGVDDPGQYKGGDWKGVTQKINEGYFGDLGVNTLWLTVPVQNADDFSGAGVGGDPHHYSSYHGYWPKDVTQPEKRFGTLAELKALVDAAHAKKMKVLFDYAMVHVHQSAQVYKDNPSWFWPTGCVCGSGACPWETTADRCWFTDYLPHWNYTVSAARDYSVGAAVQWVKDTGIDGFRLDAIKHVDGSWLTQLRSRIQSEVVAKETPAQRFYMVGETYDFGNRDFIKTFIDPASKLDGQFDFPLRLHLVQSMLQRSKPITDLASFMDSNDGFYGSGAIMSPFVGNHDLGRIIHMAEDTPMWSDPYSDGKDRSWVSQPKLPAYRAPFERVANAFAVLFTNKGAPLVYYGDEIGLPGAGDPDNRRMMQWTGLSADQQWLHDRLKKLLAIRAAHPALRRGKRTTIVGGDADLWVFSMETAGDTVYVAINRGDSTKTATGIPAGLTELVEGGTTSVPARQTRIWSSK
ncbi:MAG: alpha-amylase family glycosyl hydrolase [Polyangiales bacterium]